MYRSTSLNIASAVEVFGLTAASFSDMPGSTSRSVPASTAKPTMQSVSNLVTSIVTTSAGQGKQQITNCYCIEDVPCGTDHVGMQWMSRAGNQKQHIWLMAGRSINASGDSYLTDTDNYDIRNNVEFGCTIYLKDLSVFDEWYYSDIIGSDSVKITFDGTEWLDCRIDTNSLTLSDGEQSNGKIEIKLTYSHYEH